MHTPPPPPDGAELIRKGKVRSVFRVPDGDDGQPRVALVASDRVSAFDVVMPTPIPDKGRMLTQISEWWMRWLGARGVVETFMLPATDADVAALAGRPELAAVDLDGRVTVGRLCEVVPVECVVRGYLEGSGWTEYQETGSVCGVRVRAGLERCERLDEPIFTPATKATSGHDENISFERAAEIVGLETIGVLREVSLSIYRAAAEHAASRGLILADTKFEFGLPIDTLARAGRVWNQPILIDEALTPDSSRYWPMDTYEPGAPQPSFDKQFVREYLQGLVDEGAWAKAPPGPELPDEVVRGAASRYAELRDRICVADA